MKKIIPILLMSPLILFLLFPILRPLIEVIVVVIAFGGLKYILIGLGVLVAFFIGLFMLFRRTK